MLGRTGGIMTGERLRVGDADSVCEGDTITCRVGDNRVGVFLRKEDALVCRMEDDGVEVFSRKGDAVSGRMEDGWDQACVVS